MMSFKYKLYKNRRLAYLDKMLDEAAYIWNRALAIQNRYYSLYGKHILCSRMKAHFAKRPSRKLLTAASMQEILERQDSAFERFFAKKAKRPPKFRKPDKFRTIVFKGNCGYKVVGNEFIVNKISKRYKFSYSRPILGNIKRVIVSKTPTGEYYINVVTDANPATFGKTHDGASVGMDFGLKTFLTLSDANRINYPRYLEKDMQKVSRLSKLYSKNPSRRRRRLLNKEYKDIKNRRTDWQWKTAHSLCQKYDNIYIENLNIYGMGKMHKWGRKVYDYSFSSFVEILGHVSKKYGVYVKEISRLYPSSKTCSCCGGVYRNLSLRDRIWVCPQCGATLDRDENAAINILRQGIVSSKSVRKSGSPAGCESIRRFGNPGVCQGS